MAGFTSSEEDLNKGDIQRKPAALTSVKFSGKIDSKGRITVPARIRDKLDLESGDKISVSLDSSRVIRRKFSSKSETLEFISGLENVQEFSFDGETLEVVLRD